MMCPGTKISTACGDIAVEGLFAGDKVYLHGGGFAPIVWIGHRRLDPIRHRWPERVCPVLIEAGAIGDQMPNGDVLVSPDHALFLEGVLVPAGALINGRTIRQSTSREVIYYHIELAAHAIINAGGMPVESYLDTGNRGAFANGGVPIVLHPDFAPPQPGFRGSAPCAEAGAVVAAIRARILARAAIGTTDDPCLVIRRRRDRSAVIASRSALPGAGSADSLDRRRLGVKIGALRIGGKAVPLDHPALIDGWHDPEPDGRWTDGAAVVPASLLTRSRAIEIHVVATVYLGAPMTATL